MLEVYPVAVVGVAPRTTMVGAILVVDDAVRRRVGVLLRLQLKMRDVLQRLHRSMVRLQQCLQSRMDVLRHRSMVRLQQCLQSRMDVLRHRSMVRLQQCLQSRMDVLRQCLQLKIKGVVEI